MRVFSARNNYSFLARFMLTVSESLEKAVQNPEFHYGFQEYGAEENYVKSVLDGHREKLNFAGILLTYANFEEWLLFDINTLGKAYGCNLKLSDLNGSFIERCKKFIYKLCNIDSKELLVDWDSISDFIVVRNLIVHSNGNLTYANNREKINNVIKKYDGELSLKSDTRLVVHPKYVNRVMNLAKDTIVALNEYIGQKFY